MTDRHPCAVIEVASGHRYRIRPLNPDDKRLLVDGLERLSPRGRYYRFLAPTEHLSRAQLAYLSEVDLVDHVAWGVLTGDEPVAVGRWVRLRADRSAADVAVAVVDEHQGRGIGTALLQALAVAARLRQVAWFHFDVHRQNAAMLRLLDRMNASSTIQDDLVHGVIEVASVADPPIIEGHLPTLLGPGRRAG